VDHNFSRRVSNRDDVDFQLSSCFGRILAECDLMSA